jgi:hypothetical protein
MGQYAYGNQPVQHAIYLYIGKGDLGKLKNE